MMCRQRVAATKIDLPLMVVSGGHVRLERVRATQRSSTNFCYFSRLAHTNWRRGDDANVGKNRSARGIGYEICGAWQGSRASQRTRIVATQPPNHPTTHPNIHPLTDFKSSCDSHLSKLSYLHSVKRERWAVAGLLVLPPVCWVLPRHPDGNSLVYLHGT